MGAKVIFTKNKSTGKGRPGNKKKVLQLPENIHVVSIQTRIRPVGNSRGIILSSQLLQKAGLSEDADIILSAQEGQIIIMELKLPKEVNTDLSSWEKQYREAMRKGHKPENSLFDEVSNDFDKNEWT